MDSPGLARHPIALKWLSKMARRNDIIKDSDVYTVAELNLCKRENMKYLFFVLFIYGISFTSGYCAGESKNVAKIPYKFIYQMGIIDLESDHFAINEYVMIESKLDDVSAGDITLFIDSGNKKIPIKVDNDGSFDFPMESGLLKENPFVYANQPKGSLRIEKRFYVASEWIETNSFPYSKNWLPDLINKFSKLKNKVSSMQGIIDYNSPDIISNNLVLQLRGNMNPLKVVIKGSAGEDVYLADGNGEVIIPINADYTAKDIEVEVYASEFKIVKMSESKEDK